MSLYKGSQLISGAIPNSANQSLSNLDSAGQDKFDAKVNKSGDTMTGDLEIAIPNGHYTLKDTEFDSTTTTAPSDWRVLGTLAFSDENNAYTGFIQNSFTPNNIVQLGIGARRIINGNNKTAQFIAQVDSSGVTSCFFPNTTRCDGQFIPLWRDLISVDTSLNGSSELPYTIPEIANKGFFHMALITMTVNTGASSGNYVNGEIRSYISNIVSILRVRTRTASTMTSSGSCWIPVGVDGKIYVNRNTNWNGSMSVLRCMGYRRIGYNENA